MSGDKSLIGAFRTTDQLMPIVLDDLTEEDARRRSRGDEGPSIAWTVGHLLNSRVYAAQALGSDRENPYAEHFQGGVAATEGDGYPTLTELGTDWAALSEEVMEGLSSAGADDLDAPAPDPWHEGQTVRDRLMFLAWHEGYHLGVIGAMRKAMGYLGPAEKIMAGQEDDGS